MSSLVNFLKLTSCYWLHRDLCDHPKEGIESKSLKRNGDEKLVHYGREEENCTSGHRFRAACTQKGFVEMANAPFVHGYIPSLPKVLHVLREISF